MLKKYKEGWDKEFDTEKAVYKKVKRLQGIVVPKCYGELKYEGTRALLLSDIGGENLATPEGALLEATDLGRMLHDAFTALAQFRISQNDMKLDNFHVVGDKIMILDLEMVNENVPSERLALFNKSHVDRLTEDYEHNQYRFYVNGDIMLDA